MTHVLTLIGAPAKAPLTDVHIDLARRALAPLSVEVGAADWLADAEVCEIPVNGKPEGIVDAVRQALNPSAVDVAVVADFRRRKKLLIADMDSTLIEQECIDELADEIGHGKKVAAITERAMRGEIDFEPALRERVALLQGLHSSVVDTVLENRISLMPGGRELVQTMRANGAHTSLVSGGFTLFASQIADRLGFHDFRANTLIVGPDGRFTGEVEEPILGRDAKQQTLRSRLSEGGLEPDDALAVGDGANDLAMINLSGLGVAYRAKPAVRAQADVAIDHGDLTALLYLQGYRSEEFSR